jgi:hypothetical protein
MQQIGKVLYLKRIKSDKRYNLIWSMGWLYKHCQKSTLANVIL